MINYWVENWYTAAGDELVAVRNAGGYELWNETDKELLYMSYSYEEILNEVKRILAEVQESMIG